MGLTVLLGAGDTAVTARRPQQERLHLQRNEEVAEASGSFLTSCPLEFFVKLKTHWISFRNNSLFTSTGLIWLLLWVFPIRFSGKGKLHFFGCFAWCDQRSFPVSNQSLWGTGSGGRRQEVCTDSQSFMVFQSLQCPGCKVGHFTSPFISLILCSWLISCHRWEG